MANALILLALLLIGLLGFLTGRARQSTGRLVGIGLLIGAPIILWAAIWLLLPTTPDKGLHLIFHSMPYVAIAWYSAAGLGFAHGQWIASGRRRQ